MHRPKPKRGEHSILRYYIPAPAAYRIAAALYRIGADVTECCCVATVGGSTKKDAADLSRVRPATAQQNAETPVKAKLLDDRRNATRPNETWAMDFVHDQLATGTKLRVLTIVDTFSRFSPALELRMSFRGSDVVEVLERVGRTIGLPAMIRVDHGTEFVSRDLDLWAYQRGVTLDFSRPASLPTMPLSKRSIAASALSV